MRTGHVVFLNGPPSVGKSSTARALQHMLGTEHFYLGLDEYRRGYLDRVWIPDDGTLFQRMVAPFLHNLATLARAGHDVIAESMVSPDNEDLYLREFSDLQVLFVGLECPLEVAQERELQRRDRRQGPMELDHPLFHELHEHDFYDLRLDTSAMTPVEVAARIAPLVAMMPESSGFERLRRARVSTRRDLKEKPDRG